MTVYIEARPKENADQVAASEKVDDDLLSRQR